MAFPRCTSWQSVLYKHKHMVNVIPYSNHFSSPLGSQSRHYCAIRNSNDMAQSTRQEALEDLSTLWCTQIIQDPQWKALSSRQNSSNQLFSDTLWTQKTIRAHQSYYKKPPAGRTIGGELRVLLSLGSGLDGYPGMCHGGLLTLLFDDAIHELAAQEIPDVSITVTLNTTFRQPVRTPSVVLCRVWMEKEPQGRKAWVQASIEDGNGGVYASADSFILRMKGKL